MKKTLIRVEGDFFTKEGTKSYSSDIILSRLTDHLSISTISFILFPLFYFTFSAFAIFYNFLNFLALYIFFRLFFLQRYKSHTSFGIPFLRDETTFCLSQSQKIHTNH